jgi:enterobacterial common antigen flippase
MSKTPPTNNYLNTLKSTGLIGFSQGVSILLTVIRTKLIALFIGSAGYGVFAIYNRLMDFANSTCQLGTGMGGVREIADARAKNDLTEIEKIVFLLRFWIVFISSIAFLVFIIFSKQISLLQFKTEAYSTRIIIIAFAVIFANFYNMSTSILNGLRDIKKIAKSQILAALSGVLLALPFIYFLREKGIEWSILAVSVANAGVMIYYVRKHNIRLRFPQKAEVIKKMKSIFSVGVSYAIPGVLSSGLMYFTGIYLQNTFSLAIMGIYQACIVLSTIYIQTVIRAMGIDFLPSLMENKDNNLLFNQKISEQIELGILAAAIGVFATYIFAPYVLNLFYSKEFVAGTPILRWQIIAVFLRVMEYPLGFATTAKGKNMFYLLVQSAYVFLEFGVLVLFTKLFGVNGLGICYLVAYSLFFVVRYISMKRFSQYSFSTLLKKQLFMVLVFLTAIILISYFIPTFVGTILCSIVFVASLFWAYGVLKNEMHIVPKEILTRYLSNRRPSE